MRDELSDVEPLDKRDVHVWLVDLHRASSFADRLSPVLASAEQRRAQKFKFEKDRVKYIMAHGALRHILGGYLELYPSELEFCEGAHGKPDLVLTADRKRLRFNLSHSHEAALIAVTLGRQIGVDIEYIKREFQWEEIAERFFAPGEITTLRAVPAEDQERAFFACWTRKEAYIKAKGGGLSIPLQDFEVSLVPHQPATLRSHKSDPEEVKRWTLSEIDVGPGYAAAVAVEGNEWNLKCFRWPREAILIHSEK
jgi:4'-phosphopantetheinyl transferase